MWTRGLAAEMTDDTAHAATAALPPAAHAETQAQDEEAQAPAGAETPLQVRHIAHDTPAYRDMVALRYRVLREPLGLNYTPEQLQAEAGDTLLGIYDSAHLIGCLILTHLDAQTVQMRQVAVGPSRQGQGVGRVLVTYAEELARRQGYTTMLLHARESAVPFYLRLGYVAQGGPFEEVGLPHVEMRKNLA